MTQSDRRDTARLRRPVRDQRTLREAYIKVVNSALEDGREELARELADEYTRESIAYTAPDTRAA